MAPVTCTSCGEKGKIPDQLIGKRIRCQKCGQSFLAGTTAPPPAAPESGGAIDVDGLDASTWASSTSAVSVAIEPGAPGPAPIEPAASFVASPSAEHPATSAGRQYKVLTQKDRYFEGKFELPKLEDALNHYARQGWAVRAMATPHVTGFSGGPREEIVILLER